MKKQVVEEESFPSSLREEEEELEAVFAQVAGLKGRRLAVQGHRAGEVVGDHPFLVVLDDDHDPFLVVPLPCEEDLHAFITRSMT